MKNKILQGDSLAILKTLPDDYVHCVVTSPPYFSLRNYSVAGQIGLEKTTEEFIGKMTAIFSEVKRVLHASGTLWLNFGDSYSAGGRGGGTAKQYSNRGTRELKPTKCPAGYKPKDLLMMPFRVALALQSNGWYLRSVMPWVKRNSMPESVTDRPSSAVEYIFLLAKNPKYFYDAESVRLPLALSTAPRMTRRVSDHHKWVNGPPGQEGNIVHPPRLNAKLIGQTETKMAGTSYGGDGQGFHGHSGYFDKDGTPRFNPAGRNRRNSDWFFESWQGLYEENDEPLAMIVNPQGFKDAHFATFPEKLVLPCILAGTSEKGCCPNCREPWRRILEPTEEYRKKLKSVKITAQHSKQIAKETGKIGSASRVQEYQNAIKATTASYETLGWKQNCKCEPKEPTPCLVLDPFMGAATTAVVAKKLGRDYLGIELNLDYIKMAEKRIETECGTLI